MGNHRKKRRRESSPAPADLQLKLLKYIARSRLDKLRRLLRHHELDVNLPDASGLTPLHQACRGGSIEVVDVLIRHGGDADRIDRQGNTPGHLAALLGHTSLLLHLLKTDAPPNIDRPNARGETLRELVQAGISRGLSSFKQQQAVAAEAAVTGVQDHEWRDKLRDAASDDEGGRGGGTWDEDVRYSAAGVGAAAEDDDTWADRIWSEMRERRRAAASAAAGSFTASLREDVAARAAAAREHSERILREERAKDAAWRLRLMPATQAMAASAAQQRTAYEAAWAVLDAPAATAGGAAAARLGYSDIPWPVTEGAGVDQLRDVLLQGVEGPADVKRRLRVEILRWHPDKFGARFGGRLKAGVEAARVLARVHEVSQALTQLLAGGANAA